MVRELLSVRKEHTAFQKHDNLKMLIAEEGRRGFAYQREDMIMVCNPSGQEECFILPEGKIQYAIGEGYWKDNRYYAKPQSFVMYTYEKL